MVTLTERGELRRPGIVAERGYSGESSGYWEVAFVQMPFADMVRPSLALSLLKAALSAGGIRSRVHYANLTFLDQIGGELPDFPYLRQFLGEWIFASAAFPEQEPADPDALLARGSQVAWMSSAALQLPRMREIVLEVREFATRFVRETAREVLRHRPRIVGCSSMFEQHCAALALLREVKRLDPTVITMMGGANCEAEMGWTTLRSFSWLDFVVSGEADELILPLCRDLLATGPALDWQNLPTGVFSRAHVQADTFANREIPRASVMQMDRCAVPDFDDYFEALAATRFEGRIQPGLPVETSRGCWWGAKSHCTFCGLNGGGMTYRSKSPERVLEEFEWLSQRYGIRRLMVVDNILDMQYFKSVVPALGERKAPYQMFYETKANLKHDQVRQLAEAGVVWFQPGIEGLHDEMLKLMAKGNSAMINLQLLKYAREYGIYTTWLMLVGFPDEKDAWHTEVAEWLPLVYHLQPPSCMEPVLYERFSPFHSEQERFGLSLKPDPFYSRIFPVEPEALEHLVFYFINTAREKRMEKDPGVLALTRAVGTWYRLHRRPLRPLLCMNREADGSISIFDTRPCATARRHQLRGLQATILEACDPAITRRGVHTRFAGEAAGTEIDAAIESLKAERLLLEIHGKLLGLAVPGDCPPYCDNKAYPGGTGRRMAPFEPALLDSYHAHLVELTRTLADTAEPLPI